MATPVKLCTGWVWQLLGQWLSTTDQDNRLAGNVPSWASVACPEKEITSPTCHRNPLAGVSMTGTGGVLAAPTVIVTDWVSEAPAGSVTRSRAVTVPAAVYVWVGATAVESSN